MKNKLRFKLKPNIKDQTFKSIIKIGLICVYDDTSILNSQYGKSFKKTLYNIKHKDLLPKDLSYWDLFYLPKQTYYKSLYLYKEFSTNILFLINADRQFINIYPK